PRSFRVPMKIRTSSAAWLVFTRSSCRWVIPNQQEESYREKWGLSTPFYAFNIRVVVEIT
ncbi:MAG: hypothetical protein M1313_07340, partial [Nitrospirae bacterium]|nr:hypothetical protein [Nitrospirota bacterium]